MQSINLPTKPPSSPHPILNLSFRIFFSAAALFAIITMALWAFVFTGHTDIDAQTLNPLYWHGHEMIYGYALAVVAGFLLTAVKTWTGVMMPHGYKLLGIFMCWLLARLGWVAFGLGITVAGSGAALLYAAAIFDLLFVGWMAFVISRAVLQVKQYKQMGILAKLTLLTLGNALCYWGIISANMNLTKLGIYLGFYLIIGLVLTIGRRVVPFFIERGLSIPNAKGEKEEVTVRNNKAQDIASLLFFFVFFLVDLFYPNKYLLTISALGVAVVNIVRLAGWYHRGIWQKPLLWSLYIAFFRDVSEFCVIRTTAMARLQPQYRRPWIIHLWRGYDDSGNDGAGIARSYRSQYPSTAQNRQSYVCTDGADVCQSSIFTIGRYEPLLIMDYDGARCLDCLFCTILHQLFTDAGTPTARWLIWLIRF